MVPPDAIGHASRSEDLPALLDAIAEAVCAMDGEGRCTYVNRASAALTGYRAEEMLGRDLHDLVHARFADGTPHPREQCPAFNALTTAPIARKREVLWRADGTPQPIECSSSPIYRGGVVDGVVITLRPLVATATELPTPSTDEHHRDTFVALVSHDLRTPLAAIRGRAQVAERRLERLGLSDRAGSVVESLRKIDALAIRMAAMIDELRDLVQIQAGRPLQLRREPVDLVALVRRVADDHQQTTTWHRVRVQAPRGALVGHWDAARLERVLANLLNNAIKYSPDGGDVDVLVEAELYWVEVQVADTGVGIPDSEVDRVFERYFRGSNAASVAEGTGLGLAGARHIIHQHGGSIRVQARPEGGTRVTLRLPLELEVEVAAREPVAAPA